jgi:hypothetical protein
VIDEVLQRGGEAGLRLLDPPWREKASICVIRGRRTAHGGALHRTDRPAGKPGRTLGSQAAKGGRQQRRIVVVRPVDGTQLGVYHLGPELGERACLS